MSNIAYILSLDGYGFRKYVLMKKIRHFVKVQSPWLPIYVLKVCCTCVPREVTFTVQLPKIGLVFFTSSRSVPLIDDTSWRQVKDISIKAHLCRSTYVRSSITKMLELTDPDAYFNDILVNFSHVLFDIMNAMYDEVEPMQFIIGLSMQDPANDQNVLELAKDVRELLGVL
ncbi:uncharacterized protein ARMOST_22269 [Armillaria ostoyae]|uniref:Uncharacterized protein n=1 Tax=Armillaria ostoyae TaxID=47428 RepID=A0A284SCD9_ARMOS|nr:uncharacterized protein ARMOST_22269 [Armillaria ostoyae]